MNELDERQRFLEEELKEYEKNTEMNEEERTALREWVATGNSVHENGCLAEDGHGNYIDFLDVYREDQEIRETLSKMSPEEQEEYLAQLRGEDTINSLRREKHEMFFKLKVYERVLKEYHLLDEANVRIEDAHKRAKEMDAYIESILGPIEDRGELSWLK